MEDIKADELSGMLENPEIQENDSIILKINEETTEDRPEIGSEEWSGYVLKHLNEDEFWDGNPTTEGLRRVTVLLRGPIIESKAKTIQSPSPANDYSATVEYTITIRDDVDFYGQMITYTEVADVNSINCKDEFRKHASSTAATKAEGRALKKLLMLKHVLAAEELTEMPDDEEDSKIKKSQINFIKNLCERNNISVMKYINMGTNKYEKIDDVPYLVATKMIGALNNYQNNQSKIPEKIKGYESNWRV